MAGTVSKVSEAAEIVEAILSSAAQNQYVESVLSASGIRGKSESGAYRNVVVTKDFVVKFQRNERDLHTPSSTLLNEFKFITQCRKSVYKRHFPETYYINVNGYKVLVQEAIDMGHMHEREELETAVSGFAYDKFGIDDMHYYNFGFRGRGRSFKDVVMIDVDSRNPYR